MKHSLRLRAVGLGVLVLGGLTLGGCATKGYVRETVDTTAQGLTAKITNNEQNIQALGDQVGELKGVTTEHTAKISALDNSLRQTDGKAQQALTASQSAQSAAQQAEAKLQTNLTALDTQFENRNRLSEVSQARVQFKTDGTTLDEPAKAALNDVARRLKENPDAVVLLEGHTDASGSEEYNLQLGQKRLDSVIRYLVVQQNAPLNRISGLSFGEARAVVNPGADEENRVVVVRFMGPAAGESRVSQAR